MQQLNALKNGGIAYLNLANNNSIPYVHRAYLRNICDEAKQIYLDRWNISETNGHPNTLAHEYESTIIENFLRSL